MDVMNIPIEMYLLQWQSNRSQVIKVFVEH